MRRLAAVLTIVALAACGGYETPAADSAVAAPAPMLNLADVAGTWTVSSMREGSDSVIVTSELNATADTNGWTQVLQGRPPIAMRVRVDGDSIITEAGPYESILRPGVQVTTNGVMRLVNGQLNGTIVAHYTNAGADSVLRLRSRGTRKM